MKINSGQAPSTLIPEYIGSAFDKVVEVADNIEYVKDVATGLAGLPVHGYIGSTPPLQPLVGAEWYCTTDGRTYVWYEDNDSGQWVESSPQSTVETDPSISDNVFALWKRSAAEAGLNLVAGSFEEGGVLTSSTDVLLHKESESIYAWSGTFPKVVAAGSTPTPLGSGGWIDRSDVTLRSDLSGNDGARISPSQVSVALGVNFSSLSAWQAGESVSVGQYRIYQSAVWEANANSAVCGSEPDITSFHQISPVYGASAVVLSCFGGISGGDGTAALTRAITFAKNNGWREVLVDVPVLITGALPQLNSSGSVVVLRGVGGKRIKLDMSAAPDAAITYVGGSGSLVGVAIDNLWVNAPSKKPILCKGLGGVRVRNCQVNADIAADLSNDVGSGTFTEFFVFDACAIYCRELFRMTRGAGDASFHGCGFEGGTIINQTTGGTASGIVETNSNSAISAYNMPCNGTVFFNDATCGLHKKTGTGSHLVTFSGNLKMEPFADVTLASDSAVYLCGTTEAVSSKISLGFVQLCSSVDVLSGGGVRVAMSTMVRKYTKDSGQTSITLANILQAPSGMVMTISCSAQNYDYCQEWRATYSPNPGVISPVATKTAEDRAFNSAGYGAPVLAWSGSNLVLSNSAWSAASVSVVVTVRPCSNY